MENPKPLVGPASFRLVARTGHPSFLDLPWELPRYRAERVVLDPGPAEP